MPLEFTCTEDRLDITAVYKYAYLKARLYKYLQLFSSCLHCSACYGGKERLRNATYLSLNFLTVQSDPFNISPQHSGVQECNGFKLDFL